MSTNIVTMVWDYWLFAIFLISSLSTPKSECTDGELRLVNGTNPLEGRVEICITKAWGTVCDNLFSEADTDVVCQQIDQQMDTMHNGKNVVTIATLQI